MELGIKLPEWLPPVTEMSSEEYEKARCAAMNAECQENTVMCVMTRVLFIT